MRSLIQEYNKTYKIEQPANEMTMAQSKKLLKPGSFDYFSENP